MLRRNNSRTHFGFSLILAGAVLLMCEQLVSDERANAQSPADQDGLEISDDQLQYLVENVRDFLYRFGGRLDQSDYEFFLELPAGADVWREQAYSRLKHEAMALCRRAEQYDLLGLAEEINRIGNEYTERYTDRVRLELSQLSTTARTAVHDYVWASDFRQTRTPWELIYSMVRDDPNHPRRNLEDFLCKVANERL